MKKKLIYLVSTLALLGTSFYVYKEYTKDKNKISKLKQNVSQLKSTVKKEKVEKETKKLDLEKEKKELQEKINSLSVINDKLNKENNEIKEKLKIVDTKVDQLLELHKNKKEIVLSEKKEAKMECPQKKKKKVSYWKCKDKKAYEKCTYDSNKKWELLCRNAQKYVYTKEQVKYSEKKKTYDINESTLLHESNHVTEVIPAKKVKNPNFPDFCNNSKLDLLNKCSDLHCF